MTVEELEPFETFLTEYETDQGDLDVDRIHRDSIAALTRDTEPLAVYGIGMRFTDPDGTELDRELRELPTSTLGYLLMHLYWQTPIEIQPGIWQRSPRRYTRLLKLLIYKR